jgi:hypothetical protein
MDREKRQLRELKRTLKKAGNRHRRRQLQRDLASNPEDAAHSEADVGRNRSDTFNGIDRDSTRRPKPRKPDPE